MPKPEPIEKSPLYPIANPGSIAFFGASNHLSSMGSNLLASLQALGYPGRVYPVHPREATVRGLPAYRSVLDLPEAPDLAVLVLPADVVLPTLELCGRKGIPCAIIVSGGFREAGPAGAELEAKLLGIARRYGLRFLGPNCIGVANPHHRLNTTFLECEGRPGHIGLASQSGSFITQMFNYLARRSLGFSSAFSVGNEADLDLVDCLAYLGACPRTRVIALYVEGIRRGRRFMETARRIAAQKPIVAFYVGGSEAGGRAGRSHTGALSGPDEIYDAVFRQSGIIRAQSISELFRHLSAPGRLSLARGKPGGDSDALRRPGCRGRRCARPGGPAAGDSGARNPGAAGRHGAPHGKPQQPGGPHLHERPASVFQRDPAGHPG